MCVWGEDKRERVCAHTSCFQLTHTHSHTHTNHHLPGLGLGAGWARWTPEKLPPRNVGLSDRGEPGLRRSTLHPHFPQQQNHVTCIRQKVFEEF